MRRSIFCLLALHKHCSSFIAGIIQSRNRGRLTSLEECLVCLKISLQRTEAHVYLHRIGKLCYCHSKRRFSDILFFLYVSQRAVKSCKRNLYSLSQILHYTTLCIATSFKACQNMPLLIRVYVFGVISIGSCC